MAEILLFHHVQGLTPGVVAFADDLRAAGHTVHTPDLFEGRTFDSIEAGIAYVRELGFGPTAERGIRLADDLPTDLVYAGFSFGVMPAQELAQTRPGARGALFFDSCIFTSEWGGWPAGVPVQVHGMENDGFFAEEGGDIDAARALVKEADDAELFLYAGDKHLFADRSVATYEPEAAALLGERVLAFLARVNG